MSGDSNKRHKELVPCSSSSESIPPPPPSSTAAGIRSSSSSSWFPPPSSDLSDFTVDDYMLVEVFCRLPSIQFLGQCKCVCKSWYRIISTHFFVRRFINHHININNLAAAHGGDDTKEEGEEGDSIVLGSSSYPNNPLLLIFGYTASEEAFFRSEGHVILRFRHRHYYKYVLSNQYFPLFKKLGLDFGFVSVGRKEEDFQILAAFNDLLLCETRNPNGAFEVYLCNLFTKQWVALPPPRRPRHVEGIVAGLVCEPHCVKDARGGGEYTINDQFRYRVVFIEHAFRDKNLCVDIYSSETGKWCAFPLVDVFHRGSRLRCSSNVVNWNGKLHWHSGEDIVAFDPFDPHKTYFIQDSPDMRESPDIFPPHCYLSVCRGFLRLMKIYLLSYCRGTVMMVWELKDSRSGNWSLEHNVNLDPLMNKTSTHVSSFGLSCHPTDPNIIYFKENHDIIYCNLQSGDWEIVSQTPSNIDTNRSDIVFPVVLPPWPTPILPVPS